MKFIKLDIKKHDLNKVSELIYETDAETLNFLFKNKINSSERIAKLVKTGDNSRGYEKIHVVTNDDNQVLGVLVASIGDDDSVKNDFITYFKTLNVFDALKFILWDIFDFFTSSVDLDECDYYLADIAVDEECRGKGIGTFILEKSLELAREKGCKRVVLDVYLENKEALILYERFGFNIYNKKSFRLFGGEKGVYNMEYNIN